MQPTAVLIVVGLTEALLAHAPRLRRVARAGELRRLKPVLPAVTCSAQASLFTGALPAEHGIVGNGWYDRDLAEVHFWKQSSGLVQRPRVWDTALQRDPTFTCAQMFGWYNMHGNVKWSVTPRPTYRADGRKLPDVYTQPMDLRDELTAELGVFPLFQFWGPGASIRSTQWIVDATIHVSRKHQPTLTVAYLPHLDYALQKVGPGHAGVPAEVAALDAQAGRLLDHLQQRGARVLVVSEYGIEPVSRACPINRHLREAGLLSLRVELGREMLDPGGSQAFAVADHQVAHVYVQRPERVAEVRAYCQSLPGVAQALAGAERAAAGLAHRRAGDIVLTAQADWWFSYGWWQEDSRAPDYARTVDIHRKPGYDPLELFINPALRFPKLRLAGKLARRKLGMRTLLDVIPLDTSLVRGSHGRAEVAREYQPVLLSSEPLPGLAEELPQPAVHDVILTRIFG